MSIIKELNELHITLRTLIFGVLFNMPFWHIDLYLFKRDFFKSEPFYLPIVMSFCLSIAFIITTFFSSAIFSEFDERKRRVKLNPSNQRRQMEFQAHFAYCVLLNCVFTGIAYIFSLNMNKFLFLSFGVLLTFALMYGIGIWMLGVPKIKASQAEIKGGEAKETEATKDDEK